MHYGIRRSNHPASHCHQPSSPAKYSRQSDQSVFINAEFYFALSHLVLTFDSANQIHTLPRLLNGSINFTIQLIFMNCVSFEIIYSNKL